MVLNVPPLSSGLKKEWSQDTEVRGERDKIGGRRKGTQLHSQHYHQPPASQSHHFSH